MVRGDHAARRLESAEPGLTAPTRPFRMPVQLVNRPDQTFRGYAGTVAAGTVRPGDAVVNATSRVEARIARIVTMDGDLDVRAPGEPVTLVLDREIDASRGDVLAAAPAPALAEHIDARVVWMDDTLAVPRPRLPVDARHPDRGRHGDRHHLAAGHRDAGGNPGARAAHERDRPGGAVAVAPGGMRAVRQQPRAGRVHPGGPADPQHAWARGMVTALQGARENVDRHQLDVDKAARATLNGQKPSVLWFTGLSGAGKSTIANLVEKRLHAVGRHTMILDGDNVRHGLNRDLGFTEADRVENIRRVAEVAKLFVDAGLIVLVSFISPYRAERMLAREAVEQTSLSRSSSIRRWTNAGGAIRRGCTVGRMPGSCATSPAWMRRTRRRSIRRSGCARWNCRPRLWRSKSCRNCSAGGSLAEQSKARGFAPGPHQRALPSGLPPRAEPLGPFTWSGWTGGGHVMRLPSVPTIAGIEGSRITWPPPVQPLQTDGLQRLRLCWGIQGGKAPLAGFRAEP